MPANSFLQRLLEQVEGSHLSFVRFVGKISRHEWDWSPDEGMQSARDVIAELMREERRVYAKVAGAGAVTLSADGKDLASPAAAASALRSFRERTLAALQRCLPEADESAGRTVLPSAVSLAQLDAHALGALGVLQRLIDPSRARVSPR
jgi:hypothetical protein